MTGKPFTLYTRKKKNGQKIYYSKFKQANGRYSTAKSTGESAKSRAEAWSYAYLDKHGAPMPGRETTLEKYAEGFYDWHSTWALNKRIEGQRIGERHCLARKDIMRTHVLPVLGTFKLSEISKKEINSFRNNLYNQGYSGSYINQCLSALSQILKQAEEEELLQAVPSIKRASAKSKREKGILTIEETNRLFSFQWMTTPAYCHYPKFDIMGYTANLLAASSGLRSSEIQGLKISDLRLDNGFIIIRRAWDCRLNRLNESTKTGRERNVLIPKKVVDSIFELLKVHPAPDNPESFLFYGKKKPCEKPAEKKVFWRSLYKALKEIGISDEERKKRNITFHSWRHFLNSLLINSKIPIQKIQSITGHLTAEMTAHYYHVDDLADIRQVQEGLFAGIEILNL